MVCFVFFLSVPGDVLGFLVAQFCKESENVSSVVSNHF